MRAWICETLGEEDGLALKDTPAPDCGPGQVRVKNHFAALNFPDALMIRGLYQFKPDPPFIPGSEFAGVISAVGEGVDDVNVGQRVLALTGYGALCDEVLVTRPMQQLHVLPDSMDFEAAAAFNMTYGTALHGLRQRGNLQPGETLLVLGAAGGCGSAAVQLGKAMGARVIAGCSSEEKCAIASSLGADDVINYKKQDLRDTVKALTDGSGVDVVFDPVGEPLFSQAVRCLGWNGRMLVIGFAAGEIPSISVNYTIMKSISVIGVAYGASAIRNPAENAKSFELLFEWYQQGKIKPEISQRYSLIELPDAMRRLYAGDMVGKAVVDFR